VEGAANDALLGFLADRLEVRRQALAIVAGERSRDKRILVRGVAAALIAERLALE
jgi:uncharacterized protein YggU (UPF0235/DUF167 family)